MMIAFVKQKINALKQSRFLQLNAVKKELKKKSKHIRNSVRLPALTPKDGELIERIKEKTERLNANNVTRTTAYYDFYCRHPEIHWALLGHMVSRNGGWNMTDLKGELLSRLLSEQEQKEFFHFLERGNWLIFQDVYPQFLLYEESLKRKENLFYLLPYFHVSTFMETMWNHFMKRGDRYSLAMALIINEQNYLEQRVICNEYYRKTVLQTIEFKMQDILSLNQILFPCYRDMKNTTSTTVMVGQTLHHFASLHDRILLGKRLYSVIFNDPDVSRCITDWAADHPHTASRKDYWPHLFNDVNESLPGVPYKRKTDHCRLREHAAKIYSPSLRYVWNHVEHDKAEVGDWFKDWKVIVYFLDPKEQVNGEIYDAYCETLEKIELAVMAKTALFKRYDEKTNVL
ncbi:DUF2515 domain-containing protein [Paenibacillus thalictri]|uniref:DUF2515 domain-containing protein n=2 Tax=Paenibacillus thalictri TaxID=2527873 RepID=A0A4Q9DXE2_9BACL|nr:DUF2515 domain-containing protein [Paenibacillus thalictri]TBL81794.1 DUF2515 domain-containing protein [Paenibacillus thalictri]